MIKQDDLTIRQMTKEDISLLYKWLNNSSVSRFYGEGHKSLDEIKEKYLPRTQSNSIIKVKILEYKNKAIGYMQYYALDDEKENSFGIDQLIGEVEYWDKGLGTKFIKIMINYLREKKDAQQVKLDVDKENGRAIKCYKKCGFVIDGELDSKYYIMTWKDLSNQSLFEKYKLKS